MLLRCAAGDGNLVLAQQGIVQIAADSIELGGPRGQGVRAVGVEHVAQGQPEGIQIALHAQELERIQAVAVDQIGLQGAQP